jgi:hypothetical protein
MTLSVSCLASSAEIPAPSLGNGAAVTLLKTGMRGGCNVTSDKACMCAKTQQHRVSTSSTQGVIGGSRFLICSCNQGFMTY